MNNEVKDASPHQSRAKLRQQRKQKIAKNRFCKALIWLGAIIAIIWILKLIFSWFGGLSVFWQALVIIVVYENVSYLLKR